jgi:hypothetical protein
LSISLPGLFALQAAHAQQGVPVPDTAGPVVIAPSASTTQFFALNADSSITGATSSMSASYALQCVVAAGFAPPASATPMVFEDRNRMLYYAGTTTAGAVQAIGVGAKASGNSCGKTPVLSLDGSAALRAASDGAHSRVYFLSSGSGGADVLTAVSASNAGDSTNVGTLSKLNQASLGNGGQYTAMVADSDGIGLVAITELRTDSSTGGLWVYSPGLGKAYKVLGPGGLDLPAVNAFIIPNPKNNGGSLLVLANQDLLTSSNIFSPPLTSVIFTIIDLGQLRDLIGTASTAASITLPFDTTITTGTTPYAIFGAVYSPVTRKLYSLQGGGTSTTSTYKSVMRYDPYSPSAPGETSVGSLYYVPLVFGSLPQVTLNNAAQTMQILTTNPNTVYSMDSSGTTSSAVALALADFTFSDSNFQPSSIATNTLAGETYIASASSVDVLTLPSTQKPLGLIDIIAPQAEASAGAATDIALLSTFPVTDADLSTTNITVTAKAASTGQSFTFATIAASSTKDLPKLISGTFPANDIYTLTATYPGDSVYPALTSAKSFVAVGQAPYTTTLSVTANANSDTQATALVTLQGSTYAPTGTVTIKDSQSGTALGNATLSGALVTPIAITFNSQGTFYVTATYSGDTNNSTSSSAPTQITAKATTTSVLTAPAKATIGQAFNGTFVIHSSGVQPPVGSNPTSNVTITATQVGGTTSFFVGQIRASDAYELTATVSMTIPVVGTWRLVAHYPGDLYFLASDSAPVVVTVSDPAPAVTISTSSLNFLTPLNTPANQTFTITNSGSAALALSGITASPSTFTQQNNCGSTLAVAASCTVTVTFTPAVAGPVNGAVTIASNDPAGSKTVTLSGATTTTLVTLNPTSLTFSTTVGAATAYQDVVLTNTGNQTVTISSIAVNNTAFGQINACPASLSPGFQCTIRVNFNPNSGSGQYIGRLNVTDNATGSPQQVALNATALAPVTMTTSFSSFDDQTVGTSSFATSTVTLTNNTSNPVNISSTTLTDTTNFEVVEDKCSTALSALSSCTYRLEFHPAGVGYHTAGFGVTSSAGSPSVSFQGKGLGPGECADADHDGLCDDWEKNGYWARVNNKDVFVNLPKMGASVNHKDIFLHIDWMDTAKDAKGAHTHKPLADAMRIAVTAFSLAPIANLDGTPGINLHIDCGGCLGGVGGINNGYAIAKAIPEITNLDATAFDPKTGAFSWSTFDANSKTFNDSGRALAFHHVLFAHDQHPGYSSSGISRNPGNDLKTFQLGASDLIVSLGSWANSVGTANQQAGTLMHELGHNLGLTHGGQDWEINYKPQYLSVMNYLYQTIGLITNDGATGLFDYSEWALPTLDESKLDEATGLAYSSLLYSTTRATPAIDKMGVAFFCPGADTTKDSPHYNFNINSATNFDCDAKKVFSPKVSVDVNADGTIGTYSGYQDWPNLKFGGGAIAGNGVGSTPVASTASETYTQDQESLTKPPTRVSVTSPGLLQTAPGSTTTLRFVVTNDGTQDDAYTLTATSAAGWAGATVTPATLTLTAGASAEVTVNYTVPANAVDGDSDTIVLTAQSNNYMTVKDGAQVIAYATSTPAPLTVSVADVNFGIAATGMSSGTRMLVISNTSASALTFPMIAASPEFSQANTCGSPVAAGKSCTVTLTFSPSAIGQRTGTLSITSSASSTPVTVALTGNSIAPALLRPSVTLTATPSTTSTGQTVTLTVNVAPPSGTAKPTGTATIVNGATIVGMVTLDAGGNGTLTTNSLTAGTYELLATYNGDSAFLSANAPYQTLTIVNAAASSTVLTVSASTIPPGGAVTLTATVPTSSGTSAPTGTITFLDGATVLGTGTLNASGVATFNAASLANGTHSLTAAYGGDAVYAPSTSPAVSVSVALLTPTLALSASASTAVVGTSLTFTATITAASGTPLGTVTFYDGATVLGTGTLNGSGVATYTTSALVLGTHSITAQYAASGIYAAAVSAAKSVVITGVPDYSIAASPASLTILHGSTGSATFTITPINGYAGTLRFSCGSLPTYAQCTFSPTQLTFASTSQSTQATTLTIDTTQHASLAMPVLQNHTASRIELAGITLGSGLFGLAFTLRRGRRRSKFRALLLCFVALLGTAALMTGCASSPAAQTVAPGTYPLVITVTDGTTGHTVNYSVTVN